MGPSNDRNSPGSTDQVETVDRDHRAEALGDVGQFDRAALRLPTSRAARTSQSQLFPHTVWTHTIPREPPRRTPMRRRVSIDSFPRHTVARRNSNQGKRMFPTVRATDSLA